MGTYEPFVYCSSCGSNHFQESEMGKPITETPCKNCGVKGMMRPNNMTYEEYNSIMEQRRAQADRVHRSV